MKRLLTTSPCRSASRTRFHDFGSYRFALPQQPRLILGVRHFDATAFQNSVEAERLPTLASVVGSSAKAIADFLHTPRQSTSSESTWNADISDLLLRRGVRIRILDTEAECTCTEPSDQPERVGADSEEPSAFAAITEAIKGLEDGDVDVACVATLHLPTAKDPTYRTCLDWLDRELCRLASANASAMIVERHGRGLGATLSSPSASNQTAPRRPKSQGEDGDLDLIHYALIHF